MGPRGAIQCAGNALEADDGRLVSRYGLASPRAEGVRHALPVSRPARDHDVRRSNPAPLACRGKGSGGGMNRAAVEKIARAILYEGYLLYPYRRSAIKNQMR